MKDRTVTALFKHLPEFNRIIALAESPEKARDGVLIHPTISEGEAHENQ